MMRVLPAAAYYQELLQLIPAAKQRIVLAAMIIRGDEQVVRIFELLLAARKRGIKVSVLTDVYYKFSLPRGMQQAELKDYSRTTALWLAKLKTAGAEVWEVGQLKLNPAKGRCHIKVTVIDDQVLSFGGVNVSQIDFEQVDYMLATQDRELGNTLAELVHKIGDNQPIADFEHPIAKDTSILFDAGVTKKSVIYDHAMQLTRRAKTVRVCSQMVPSGKLAAAIKRTNYQAYFNWPMRASYLEATAILVDSVRYRVHNSYDRPGYLHAKCILFELKDGGKALITGSHNFSWRGVVYGTKEIALYSTNERLWQQLDDYINQHVA